MRHWLTAGLALAALLLAAGVRGQERAFFLRPDQTVLFLGDSNTFAGGFIDYVDAYLTTRFPDDAYPLLNLGLPSETVSGLSEPDHPYPRPDLHERLDRALAQVKPAVVVACYGMNDGIYYPFSEERFAKYQDGIRRLLKKIAGAGAKAVLLTPPPFDVEPVRAKALADGAPKYSWVAPYAGYDQVLERYSRWLLTLRSPSVSVIDIHTPIAKHLAAVRRTNPAYKLSGDGVHVDGTGHWLIAQALLEAWGAPAEADGAEIDARTLAAARGKVVATSRDGDGVKLAWTSRVPMPMDPKWNPLMVKEERVAERFNRYRLVVRGLKPGKYALFEDDRRLGEADAAELEAGLDLLRFPELSTNRRAAQLLPLVSAQEKLIGLARLTAVGHKRPGTPTGLPLAQATPKALEQELKIRTLAEPVTLHLRLVPAPG